MEPSCCIWTYFVVFIDFIVLELFFQTEKIIMKYKIFVCFLQILEIKNFFLIYKVCLKK